MFPLCTVYINYQLLSQIVKSSKKKFNIHATYIYTLFFNQTDLNDIKINKRTIKHIGSFVKLTLELRISYNIYCVFENDPYQWMVKWKSKVVRNSSNALLAKTIGWHNLSFRYHLEAVCKINIC